MQAINEQLTYLVDVRVNHPVRLAGYVYTAVQLRKCIQQQDRSLRSFETCPLVGFREEQACFSDCTESE